MKCTKCGKEMTIRPIQTGTDESGEPVFTRYAFCYDCKIKVNLDKKKERNPSETPQVGRVEETKTKVKRKKKKGRQLPSVSLPKRKGGRGKKKAEKEKRGGSLLKFLILLVLIAALGFVGYTYRKPIAKFAQQMYGKYIEQKEEKQKDEPKSEDSGNHSEGSDVTAKPDIAEPQNAEPQNENEPTDDAGEEGQGDVPKTEDGAAQSTPETSSSGTAAEPQ